MVIISYPVQWLILYLLRSIFYSFIWINEVSMILVVFQEVIFLYDYLMIIIIYLVHWLILYLLKSACFVSIHVIIIIGMLLVCLPKGDYFVWLWHDYYLILRSLIDWLLALIFMLFLFIWNFQCVYMFALYKKWLLWMVTTWLLSFIQFIDWFFTCLDLFVLFLFKLL